MTNGVAFYKIKIIKKLIECTAINRKSLLEELAVNGTDPTIVKRRLRMLRHLNSYESQLISKIQNFETDDVNDLNSFDFNARISNVVHRSA